MEAREIRFATYDTARGQWQTDTHKDKYMTAHLANRSKRTIKRGRTNIYNASPSEQKQEDDEERAQKAQELQPQVQS